jgi:ABC-type uncharacterized transport system substrate-binding protein
MALGAGAAAAHPHVFIDAEARFVIDAERRLTSVRMTHVYDALVSLFVLQELGIDPFAALDDASARRLAEEQRIVLDASGGYAALTVDGRDVALRPARGVAARLDEDGRLRVDFTLEPDAPPSLARSDALLAVYDPVYFISFALENAEVDAADCVAATLEWRPSGSLLALRDALSAIPVDETPDDPEVGRLFAAEARVSCR